MNLGNIIDIPLVNVKCPIAVNNSINDMAILADKAKSYSFWPYLITQIDSAKHSKSTISGFILVLVLSNCKGQYPPK